MKTQSTGRIIALIALLSAFPPLATDMYLPALPTLQAQWNQPLSVINLTLIAFFITYCFFLLVYGPLSDRFGRKPPLIVGICIYIVGSFLCASAPSIYLLIFYRTLQASGAAAASAIAMAIIKDRIPGEKREKTMVQVAVIPALAPMIAPVIGGIIMTFFSWPWVFIMQAILGIFSLISVIMMQESRPKDNTAPESFIRRYIGVLKNKRFMGIVMIASLATVPIFAFIAGSSDIYITRMGISEATFGFLFGANVFCFIVGSFFFTKLSPHFGNLRLMNLGFVGMFLGGLGLIFIPLSGPMQLALPMGIFTFCMGLCRPQANNIALEQVDKDAGSASSILIFFYFVLGAFSMFFISLDWTDKIHTIGLMTSFSGGTCLLAWHLLKPHLRMPGIAVTKKNSPSGS